LRQACREAASWTKPLSIAVNLSPINFRRGDISASILSILIETGLDPKRLEIEITEGVLIQDFSRAISLLGKIKNLGVRVAMDDFGTGYSSLSYLQSFAFDKIKIDQMFVGQLGNNSHSAAIIRAILGLGQALKLPVVAEGVETEVQRAFLVAEGCDELQGYLIGRPQPIARYRGVFDARPTAIAS
jgi:EAL domain-containing protein (putative c-di-GMP-specific phosphodiesterase class I)